MEYDYVGEVDDLYARFSCSLSALEIIWYTCTDCTAVNKETANMRTDALYAVLLQLQALTEELGELASTGIKRKVRAAK